MNRSRSLLAAVSATVATAAVALGLLAGPAGADDENAQITPLAFDLVASPNPVIGADGKRHLAYELKFQNRSDLDVTIESVQSRAGGADIGAAADGDRLNELLFHDGGFGQGTNEIEAGRSGMLFMDVAYARSATTPQMLRHEVTLSWQPGSGPRTEQTFNGLAVPVTRGRPLEVQPPLRGDDWVVGNGCCDAPINAHRGAALSIDGTTRVPERFAIDFVRLDDEDRVVSGPIADLESYEYFGEKVRSATAGKVVSVRDGEPEQVPGSLPEGQTVQTAGGNHIVIRVDRDHWAFYAHLQPGSLRVEPGDRVRPGQAIGLLGNTGNTDAPHLHFHIMDSPSPLLSNGLPFTFPRFSSRGTVTNIVQTADGTPADIDTSRNAGAFRDVMPLDNMVIGFPER